MKKLLDTNLLIRFLLNDNPKQAQAIQNLLETSKEFLVLTDVSFAEIIWVLTSYYKLPKTQIVEKLKHILTLTVIEANKPCLFKALANYESHNLDYINAYLAAYAQGKKIREIYSYDRDFDKLPSIDRVEP